MKKYIDYVKQFHEWNQTEIEFIENQLKKHLSENEENQTEIETILDYLFSNPKVNISKIWYKTILEKTEKWHKKLSQLETKDDEEVWVDYEIVLDFKDWFKFVKLISQNSYNREWKIMSHCVASYFWRKVNIYSLRDSNNKPHCTIEENQQVKGKWNWSIDPKYIDYVVKFLEHLRMSVWENEMKNLGYYKLEKIDKNLTSNYLYNWYIYENKLDTIKDKDWNQYNWFWLLNIRDLVIFKNDFGFSINLNIKETVEYLLNWIKWLFNKISDKEDDVLVDKKNSAQIWSSWNYAKIWSSWYYAKIWSSWYSAQIWSSGDYAKIWSSGDSAKIWSSWYSAQISSEWENAVIAWIWYNNQIKAKKWSWITLAEYDNYWICACVKSQQIDWVILKEDTFYKLEKWEFKEII